MMPLPRPVPPVRTRTPSTIPLFERTDEEEGSPAPANTPGIASDILRSPSEDKEYKTHVEDDDDDDFGGAVAASALELPPTPAPALAEGGADDGSVAGSLPGSVNGIFLDDAGRPHVTTIAQQHASSQTLSRYRRLVMVLSLGIVLLFVALVAVIGVAVPKIQALQAKDEQQHWEDTQLSDIRSASCLPRGGTLFAKMVEVPIDRPHNAQVAVLGERMVIVVRNVDTTTDVHVIFYALRKSHSRGEGEGGTTTTTTTTDGGTWVKGNHFVLDYGETFTDHRRALMMEEHVNPAFAKVSVALSDTSALVGFPYSHGETYTDSVSNPGDWRSVGIHREDSVRKEFTTGCSRTM